MAAAIVDSPSTSCFSETLKLLRNDNLKNDNTDVQEFQKRIKTFILGQKWVRKPLALSPPVCARFGWECRGPNKLQCVSCSAILCTSLPEMENSKSYDKCIEDVLKSLKTSHRKHCPWPLAPCPESFFQMFPVRKETAFEDFASRLESLLPIEKCLPEVKGSVAEALALSEDHFKVLCELSHVSDSPFTRSSILLAATGWRRMPDATKKKYITCINCERTVGVWFYLPVQSKVTEKCIPKLEGETNQLPPSSDTSSETTQENTFPCTNSHTSDESNERCVNAVTSSPQDCQEDTQCKQESVVNSESPHRQKGKRLNTDENSSVAEEQILPTKKLCLETDKPFDSLYEHRPWCMWISKTSHVTISQSGAGDAESLCPRIVPGYEVYIDCLLKNGTNSNSSASSLSSPTREQLYKARELLMTWSSPA